MILDGKKLRDDILNNLKDKITGLNLSLAIIQIGNNEASNVYIKQKKLMCEKLNIKFKHFKFNEQVEEIDIIKTIDELNNDDTTGILLQLPIPPNIDSYLLQNRIKPNKDVDGLTIDNIGNLISQKPCLMPCTAKGVIELLKHYQIEIEGKNVVVVGRSNLVGKPVAQLLLNENATVTICHLRTNNLKEHTIKADIIIVAAGSKHLITKDMVKEESVVVDVGINKYDDKLYGDVDFENVKEKVSYISPVPGGVGPMTIAMLAQNIYEAYLLQK